MGDLDLFVKAIQLKRQKMLLST